MVEIAEPSRGAYNFNGRVEEVLKEFNNKFLNERFHIIIAPLDKDWKNMHTWIPINKESTEIKVIRGTALGEYIQQLHSIGIYGATISEVMQNMVGKPFLFIKRRVGRMEKEVWFPKEML